ncbi:MAG: sulfite exporter TauE/SafE family protein [Bacillaceae bacterium]|nr:sulfite exporter TauE/SafE family protein [Bacillaceae bacterium]
MIGIDMIIIFILLGVFAGTFGSLAGLGGGVILVPALLYLSGVIPGSNPVTPQIAVGTSLVVIIITALSSTLAYTRQKMVDFKSAILFFAASGPGSVVGAWVNRGLEVNQFQLYFGLFLIALFFLVSRRDKWKPKNIKWTTKRVYVDDDGVEQAYGYHIGLALPVSFFVGMFSGLFGIGGGALMVPVMLIFFRFPPRMATATSMMVIFLSAITGSLTHFLMGNIHWIYALSLAPGAWVGGKLGALISARIGGKGVELFFRMSLLVIALKLIGEGI